MTSSVAPTNDRGALREYAVTGKLRFKRQDERVSASFWFVRRRDSFQLRVSGPLGLGAQEFHGQWSDPSWLKTEQKDGPVGVHLQDLGLPNARELERWLLCLPTAPYPSEDRNAVRAARLASGVWNIQCTNWRTLGALTLPHRILAEGQQGESLLMVTRRWRFAESSP